MEGVLLLATLAQGWRMHLATAITVDPRITLRLREPVKMQLTRVRDAARQETVQ